MALYISATDDNGVIEPTLGARPIGEKELAHTHDLSTLRVIEPLTGHFYWDELVEVDDWLYGYPAKLLRRG